MHQPLASAIRAQTFPAHPYFPQLPTASDPRMMLDLFRKHLVRTSEGSSDFEQCLPLRFRWRSDGSQCVLQYALRMGANGNGPLPDLWVTATIYAAPGGAEQAWTKHAAACASRPAPETESPFQPLTLIPELGMLAKVFPCDRLLPSLPELVSGPWPELRQRLLACFGPGQWQIETQTVEPLRYLAEDSAVLRYSLHARNAGNSQAAHKRFYAKAYRTSYGEQIGQLLQQFQRKTAGAREDFTVVEPLFYCAQRQCLVLAEAPGRSLQERLENGGQDVLPAVRRVARALTAFNQTDIVPSVSHSAEEQIKFLASAAELLRWACPALTTAIENIVHIVSSNLRDVPPAPIHWDLKTDHIFLDDDRVTFVDLDTFSLGDPARDPAHLAAHLACRIEVPDMPADLARAAARTLVEEYFSQVPETRHQQFELQYLIAVLEGACGLFKRQEPRWAERAAAALEEAQRALTGRAPLL
jgi:hypothetical protein